MLFIHVIKRPSHINKRLFSKIKSVQLRGSQEVKTHKRVVTIPDFRMSPESENNETFVVTIAKTSQEVHKWLNRNDLIINNEKNKEEMFLNDINSHRENDESILQYVGFDVEWRPTFQSGKVSRTAVLQLAVDNEALVVQLRYFAPVTLSYIAETLGFLDKKYLCDENEVIGTTQDKNKLEQFPPSLIKLLSSNRIVKVGVGVLDDLAKLQTDFGTPIGAFRDFGLTAQRVLSIQKYGLKGLVSYLFGVELHKPKRISLSNWNLATLSPKQIRYAAQDALVSYYICKELQAVGIFSKEYNIDAEKKLRNMIRQGNRRAYKNAMFMAAESEFLFDFIHNYVSTESDTSKYVCGPTDSAVSQVLKTFCIRANAQASVITSVQNKSFKIQVLVNDVVVKEYVDEEGNLSKQQKAALKNKLCSEVLSELLHLQRTCVENNTYNLLRIYSSRRLHLPLHHQLLPLSEKEHEKHNLSKFCQNTLEILNVDQVPSFITDYIQNRSVSSFNNAD